MSFSHIVEGVFMINITPVPAVYLFYSKSYQYFRITVFELAVTENDLIWVIFKFQVLVILKLTGLGTCTLAWYEILS